jgi:hypothetical protein
MHPAHRFTTQRSCSLCHIHHFVTPLRACSLDGRDCNGYYGIAWCFGATDRPHPVSAVFGAVRQMTSRGVASRINAPQYLQQASRRWHCCEVRVWFSNWRGKRPVKGSTLRLA